MPAPPPQKNQHRHHAAVGRQRPSADILHEVDQLGTNRLEELIDFTADR